MGPVIVSPAVYKLHHLTIYLLAAAILATVILLILARTRR